jgi:hypothetical protein
MATSFTSAPRPAGAADRPLSAVFVGLRDQFMMAAREFPRLVVYVVKHADLLTLPANFYQNRRAGDEAKFCLDLEGRVS